MKIEESAWGAIQQHMGYTGEEMVLFRQNPRNEEVLLKAPELMNKTIVGEVVESHGCNSQHKVGEKFYLDGAGNLLSKLCPKRMCIYAVQAMVPAVFTANELLYAGVDPNQMRFKRTGCFDVGVRCGGWGRIIMEVRVEDRRRE